MKKKTFLILLSTFALFMSCSDDDMTPPDSTCEETSTCELDPTGNATWEQDKVNKNLTLEGIYFIGTNKNNIKTDNGPLFAQKDELIQTSTGKQHFYTHSAYTAKINTDAIFMVVAGQGVNANKDVFNIPEVTNFGYNAVLIVSAADAPGLIPNAVIKPLQDIVVDTGSVGTDQNSQSYLPLISGKFKIETLNGSNALWQTSDGSLVQSSTYTVDPSAFARNADGVLTVYGEAQGFTATSQLNGVFNNNDIEVCVLQIIDGNPKNGAQAVVKYLYE